MQMSFHSQFNHPNAFEAMRAASMLSSGVCMFAEKSGLDEEAYTGIVHFISGEEANETFREFRGNSAAIRRCQARSAQAYCERFQPLDLLNASGFLPQLDRIQSGEDLLKGHPRPPRTGAEEVR
mmetsp:Transcript_47630/g.113164  ORF Transcript_47630/g.113164 Transcript_47630/m.113164 type:complete len:124 (+) Transcript_47630:3-374(+)